MHALVLDPVHSSVIEELRRDGAVTYRPGLSEPEVISLIGDADVVVVRSGVRITRPIIEAGRSLQVIARAGVGLDGIDLDAARGRGITVLNVPSMSGGAVAELALGALLALARKIVVADRQVRSGVWAKAQLQGFELAGRTMGIVGLGAIGSRIAELAVGFGMEVCATVASPSPSRAKTLRHKNIRLVNLPELLSAADVVCLAVPLDTDTRDLIGAAELDRMRSHALLVNVSRAGIVDEEALLAALVERRIGGAALDVHRHEAGVPAFAGLDTVVLTPHIGAMTEETQARIGAAVVTAIRAAIGGELVATTVS